jgi:two-component system cell cycle response regulator CpdR
MQRLAAGSSSNRKFTASLPECRLIRSRENGTGVGRDHPPARAQQAIRGMTKILLAEDDTDMRRFLVKALQQAGYEVISYDNGLSAYQRLREEPFELLLTDIVMPEMDGIELARRAAELDPDIKIMFITGFAAVALNSDSSAPKHAKVLSKPIHLRELVNEVQKLLAA